MALPIQATGDFVNTGDVAMPSSPSNGSGQSDPYGPIGNIAIDVGNRGWRGVSYFFFALSSLTPAGRSFPVASTYRYSVGLMPSSWQRASTLVSRLSIAACARRSIDGIMAHGRPPLRPRARAAFKPATVRSRIRGPRLSGTENRRKRCPPVGLARTRNRRSIGFSR